MPGPLTDIRVVDLSTGPAGGLATMILADFGADVLKVEPPGGDPFRRLANAPMWLRGKRSVLLDLSLPAGRDRLHDLARGADVVVASFPPGTAEPLGVDHGTLRRLNPGLVYCSVTGWGPRGPYARDPAYEGLVAARSGRMQVFQGLPRREGPAYAAVQVATHACAQSAVQGILAALLARDRLGAGQLVETSLLQGMIPYDTAGLTGAQLGDRITRQVGPAAADGLRMPTLNYHPVMAGDGRWIQLGNLLEHLFYSFLVATDLTEFLTGEEYQGQPATWAAEAREAARDAILLRMRERTADEWMEIFRTNGNVAAEPFATTQDALTNIEFTANGDVVETEHPHLGRVRQLGLVARLEQTPGAVANVEPLVGEHTDAVLAEPPRASWQPDSASGTDVPRYPLDGVTVVEFSTIIATPLAASLLGDLGARVIKVEPPGGDPGRRLGAGSVKWNASKESICADLKTPEGQEIARRLLAKADIVLHNYRPGVPERLGIGYEDACRLNPAVVYVGANGYGPDAPGALRPSAHPIPGAAAGGALFQAGAGMPLPHCESLAELRETARHLMRSNEVNPDPNTSMVIATAALLGLYAARRHGAGQRIFVNMLGANAYANHDDAISYEGKPPRPLVDAEVYGTSPLERLYPARSGWVFLGIVEEAEWQAFCSATGRADLAGGPRFATADARRAHDAELAAELGSLFASRDADEWESALIGAAVGCVRADASMPGAFWAEDRHVQENGFVVQAEHPRHGPYLRHGPLVTFDRTPARCGHATVGGQHTDQLLAELGYDAEAIAGLRARGIVSTEAQ